MTLYGAFWFVGAIFGFFGGKTFASTLYSYETVEGELFVFGDRLTYCLIALYFVLRIGLCVLSSFDPITCSQDWFCGARGILMGTFVGFFAGRLFGLEGRRSQS